MPYLRGRHTNKFIIYTNMLEIRNKVNYSSQYYLATDETDFMSW